MKRATWFILLHNGKVLLERRPSSGLWGGLWIFPEREPDGVDIITRRVLPEFQHGFTHFTLNIQPLVCEVSRVQTAVESGGRRWLSLDQAVAAPVPSPVRALLEKYKCRT